MNTFRKKNLHLFLTTSVIESRMTKEVEYTISNKIIHDAYVSALWDKGLPINDKIGNLNIIRQSTLIKKLQARGWFEKKNTYSIDSCWLWFLRISIKINSDFFENQAGFR